jgi:CMP/dCMP kinase
MRITISGTAGSGKSTLARILAKKLKYDHYSIGDLMREIAKDRDISINSLSKIAEKDQSIDLELDKKQKELATQDNFIIDSRLGFHFIPNSFKILLTVDLNEAARRIFNDNRHTESYDSIEKCKKEITRRIESEKKRYKKYYNIDYPKKIKFDLEIDTTSKSPGEIADIIIAKLEGK